MRKHGHPAPDRDPLQSHHVALQGEFRQHHDVHHGADGGGAGLLGDVGVIRRGQSDQASDKLQQFLRPRRIIHVADDGPLPVRASGAVFGGGHQVTTAGDVRVPAHGLLPAGGRRMGRG